MPLQHKINKFLLSTLWPTWNRLTCLPKPVTWGANTEKNRKKLLQQPFSLNAHVKLPGNCVVAKHRGKGLQDTECNGLREGSEERDVGERWWSLPVSASLLATRTGTLACCIHFMPQASFTSTQRATWFPTFAIGWLQDLTLQEGLQMGLQWMRLCIQGKLLTCTYVAIALSQVGLPPSKRTAYLISTQLTDNVVYH